MQNCDFESIFSYVQDHEDIKIITDIFSDNEEKVLRNAEVIFLQACKYIKDDVLRSELLDYFKDISVKCVNNNLLPSESNKIPQKIVNEAREIGLDYSGIMINKEGIYSTTLPRSFPQLAEIYKIALRNFRPKSILDATANVGGDVLFLRGLYPQAKITAIEKNKDNYLILKYNLSKIPEIFKKYNEKNNIKVREILDDDIIHDDSTVHLLGPDDAPKYDMILFDPPWGGTDYKSKDSISLQLSQFSIGTIIGHALSYNTNIVSLKAPLNLNEEKMHTDIVKIIGHNFNVQKFFVYKKNSTPSYAVYIIEFYR